MKTQVNPTQNSKPAFTHAPEMWRKSEAEKMAMQEGISLTDDHWMVLDALQEYFARHEDITLNVRELHDALDEKFHGKGGMKYLYKLFPGGPVAQGGRIAGLKVPAGAKDLSFGSVQ